MSRLCGAIDGAGLCSNRSLLRLSWSATGHDTASVIIVDVFPCCFSSFAVVALILLAPTFVVHSDTLRGVRE